MAHLGQNIAKLRGIRRLTQKEMAIKMKLGQPEYSKIEQKAEIEDDLLDLIAAALDVTPDAIKNFNEDAAINVISSTLNDYSAVVYNYPILHVNPIEKLIEAMESNKELYERIIREKDDIIKQKEEIIELLRKQQKV